MNEFAVKILFSNKRFWIKCFIIFSIFVLTVDTVYKAWFGITYQTRQNCILYSNLPKWAFLIYEYIFELLFVLVMGIFIGVLIEKHFIKMKRFIPQSVFSSFVFSSILPVCSCSVIPLIKSMNNRVPQRVIFTMIIAAPLLNPYIIIVSATMLGIEYTLLRIVLAFMLAISSGYILELFYNKSKLEQLGFAYACPQENGCVVHLSDVFEDTFSILKKIIPFVLIAGLLSIFVEVLITSELKNPFDFSNNITGTLMTIAVGVPVYFCNGADVLFIKPLIRFGNMPLGTALTFSMTSTAVCISSLTMLIKYVGKKLTFVLLGWVILFTFTSGIVINMLSYLSSS